MLGEKRLAGVVMMAARRAISRPGTDPRPTRLKGVCVCVCVPTTDACGGVCEVEVEKMEHCDWGER